MFSCCFSNTYQCAAHVFHNLTPTHLAGGASPSVLLCFVSRNNGKCSVMNRAEDSLFIICSHYHLLSDVHILLTKLAPFTVCCAVISMVGVLAYKYTT